MATLGQSLFLQALGWATLNSFWQMAALWALYASIQHYFKLSAHQKYKVALVSLGLGFGWYAFTFLHFYNNGPQGTLLASANGIAPTSSTWSMILSSASIAYLLLLLFPAYRLVKNWQFIGTLRRQGLEKTDMSYRLFVKKVAHRLGINKSVHIYISQLVTSPVTIGYFKPIILLPVAALNSLTLQQAEAILLHELAHIKRSDFLINLIVTFLHTLFYYNPFLKKFVAVIEAEREKCCDELVLQFQYDKISYASALLTLEKNAAALQALTLAATGGQHLLKRIEKIVGMEKKPSFSFTHLAGIMASLLLVVFINSLLFVSKQKMEPRKDLSLVAFENPFYAADRGDRVLTSPKNKIPATAPIIMMASVQVKKAQKVSLLTNEEVFLKEDTFYPSVEAQPFITVAYNEAEAAVSVAEKVQVSAAVAATKKVLSTNQWKEVEKEIGDGMTAAEKEIAHKEFLQELESLDWKNLENKLKTNYKDINWDKINLSLNEALVAMKLDSLHQTYSNILKELQLVEAKATQECTTVLPLPDASTTEIMFIKEKIQSRIDSINAIRNKKVIAL